MKNCKFHLGYSLIIAVCISLFSGSAFAQTFPEKPVPAKFVNDFARIYSAEEVNLLETKLSDYERQTSTQIAIITITSLDGYPIDDYTIKLGNKWGIGQKDKNNGLLIVIAKNDHKIFIATGYGMEGALNDGKLGTIIRNDIIPYFKNNDYYGGTNAGIDAMIAAAAGEYQNEQNVQKVEYIWIILILSFAIFCVAGIISKYRRVKKYALLNNVSFWVSWSVITITDAKSKRKANIFESFNSLGGSSFGGGRFGGGGAGGSW